MRSLALGLVLTSIGLSAPAFAQDSSASTAQLSYEADLTVAEQRGLTMWLYDQAAWHATDALLGAVNPNKITKPRGYLVLPRPSDAMLDTVFIVERDGELREFARYTVDGSKVVSGGLASGSLPALSPLAQRMFAARQAGVEAMRERDFRLCSKSMPNTLVLPPDGDENINVYLLTSTTDARYYPMGGHYRARVDASGKVVETRRFMNACLDLATGIGARGEKQVWTGVIYLLGDTPSEIHVFVARHLSGPLAVMTTSNTAQWLIKNGEITLQDER